MPNMSEATIQFGTKAETLAALAEKGFSVPDVFFFAVREWEESSEGILARISSHFRGITDLFAVRSSSLAEDG